MKLPSSTLLDKHLRELLQGTSLALFHRVCGMACSFLLSVAFARSLGANGFGIFALAGTSTTIAAILARLGLDNAMLRYASAAAHQQNWSDVAGVYRTGMAVAVLASLGATLMLILLAPTLAVQVFDDPAVALPTRIMALTILPTTITTLHGEMLKALRLTGKANLVQASAPPVVNGVILGIALAVLSGGVTPSHVAWIAFAAGIAMSVLSAWLLQRHMPHLRGQSGFFAAGRLVGTSVPLFWIAALNLVMGATDIVMLGIWTATDQVALYSTAARVAMLVSFPLVAISTISSPMLAGLHAAGDRANLRQVTRATTAVSMLIALPVAALFWLYPKYPLLLFGKEFVPASTTLALLTLGHCVNVATGPVGNLLMLTGHEKLMRNNIAASSVINVLLNMALIPNFGIAGAAVATAISLAIMNVASLFLVYRELGVFPFWFPTFAFKR